MQHIDGYKIKDWTWLWTLLHSLSINVQCAVIKQAKGLKPLFYGEWWLIYKYGAAWWIDYITFAQTHQSTHHVLTMVKATQTHTLCPMPLPRTSPWALQSKTYGNMAIESDNTTHFQNSLMDSWSKDHGTEWVYHISYHTHSCCKDQMLQCTTKNHADNNCARTLKKQGQAFGTNHLVSRH